jgi:hypothetical protein
MLAQGSSQPAEVLATLLDNGANVVPTPRYVLAHQPWSAQRNGPPENRTMSLQPQVYGLYARAEPAQRWIHPSVHELITRYPQTLGSTGGIPNGWETFTVPNALQETDPWILLYVGRSGVRGDGQNSRIQDYLGTGMSFTSAFGQSLQAELALLFGGSIDSRYGANDGTAKAINRRITNVLSRQLTDRFQEMQLAYVCVECPEPQISANENALVSIRVGATAPTGRPWPTGARPLINADF